MPDVDEVSATIAVIAVGVLALGFVVLIGGVGRTDE